MTGRRKHIIGAQNNMKRTIQLIATAVLAVTFAISLAARDRISDERISPEATRAKLQDESRSPLPAEAKIDTSVESTAVSPTAPASQQTKAPLAGEQIDWWVIGGGGGSASSASFQLSGTVGQPAVGVAGSSSYTVNHGFWQDFSSGTSGCCVGSTGNVNGDAGEAVDLSDLIYLVNYLFLGGPAPPCVGEANTNGDVGCSVDLSDLIYLVNYLFLGGTAPAACLPGC